MMKYSIAAVLLIATFACSSIQNSRDNTPETPTNIIFLIGDGMGLSAVSTAFYFNEEPSQFNQFKHIGLIRSSSATDKVTDSGAGGTAMATGRKTYNGAIGVDTLKTPVQNITELTSALGWSTGVVATSTITHATPASFYGHVEQRSMEEVLALQLLDSEIDFFAGGGIYLFNDRKDSTDLFPLAAEKGFIVDTTALPAPGSLPEATSLALELLSHSEIGFFLMVEGSQIDWEGHGNNPEGIVAEVLDFENAIAVALDFAKKDGHTLVVVSADHETGGLALAARLNPETGERDSREVGLEFATTDHSATLIPVFAYGPGAEDFMGIYENTELFHKMAALAEGK
jgi:alkaline phosphatase